MTTDRLGRKESALPGTSDEVIGADSSKLAVKTVLIRLARALGRMEALNHVADEFGGAKPESNSERKSAESV